MNSAIYYLRPTKYTTAVTFLRKIGAEKETDFFYFFLGGGGFLCISLRHVCGRQSHVRKFQMMKKKNSDPSTRGTATNTLYPLIFLLPPLNVWKEAFAFSHALFFLTDTRA